MNTNTKSLPMAFDAGGHPKFYDILNDLAILHTRKNHDYAEDSNPLSNLKRCEKLSIPPWVGCIVRMQDKFDRIENFAKMGFLKVADETIIDTLNDLAVYAILCRILYEEGEPAKIMTASEALSLEKTDHEGN